jgi:Domain of unknown function (DUF4919)
MMHKLVSALFMLVLVSVVSFSSTQDPPKNSAQDSPKRSFALLLERAKKSDATLDFRELRMAYTETTNYSPYGGDRETRKAMFAALSAKEYDHAVEFAEKILAKNYVEINAHFVAYVAHRESGRAEKATFHKYMFDGLVKSITNSGDGKTAETAFVVITTDEEYTLFNVLGLRPAGQALVAQNGHSFDRMTATNPKTNEAVVYFFNIDKPFNWLGESMKK